MALARLLVAVLFQVCGAWSNTSVSSLNGRKAIIGYWGSAANLPKESQLGEALKRGYNVISLAFGDTLKADGSFEIHTNLGAPPTKATISSAAGMPGGDWQYLLSFGGQNAAGPSVTDVDAYVSGFMKTYEAAQEKYGFDGIDIDIETGMATPLLKALRKIFKQLHAEGQAISMAPQPLNIDPKEVTSFMAGAYNCYVPLVDTTIIDTVTYIAVQLYNNAMPLNSLDAYIDSMQAGLKIAWEGSALEVNIPSEKLVFGYPASPGAAPSGAAESWEMPGSSLASHYRNSAKLMATGGCMTWSIGWDASQGWSWVSAVHGLWNADRVKEANAVSPDINCHSISPAVSDAWCNTNCNFSPPSCPAQYCQCGAPTPAPTPGPTPAPGPRPSGPVSGFFLAPYAASSSGTAPASATMAIYFWGMPPSSWAQFTKQQPNEYTAAKLLPGSFYYKVLNLGGGGTAWTDTTIANAKAFLPTVKQLGYNGVCFDTEVFGQFTMAKFLDLFASAKAQQLTTVLTSTAEGPYSGCDSPNDCWRDIQWDNVDFMVPQMYGASGGNYPAAQMKQYATFWQQGGGQGVHGKFSGPKDLNKILWAVDDGTGASMLSTYSFAGGYVEWAYKSLGSQAVLV